MVRRRDLLRNFVLASFGMVGIAGCGGPDMGPPPKPLGKSRDESQKESELPFGLEHLQKKAKQKKKGGSK
jgi:hypothetical protein